MAARKPEKVVPVLVKHLTAWCSEATEAEVQTFAVSVEEALWVRGAYAKDFKSLVGKLKEGDVPATSVLASPAKALLVSLLGEAPAVVPATTLTVAKAPATPCAPTGGEGRQEADGGDGDSDGAEDDGKGDGEEKKKNMKKKKKKKAKGVLCVRAERQEAGKGRGHGMFVKEAIAKGGIIVRARPVLSVVHDPVATKICAFCFASTELGNVTIQACESCKQSAICNKCALNESLRRWHKWECDAFQALPAASKKGDSSVLRILLRLRMTQEHGEWCGSGEKSSEGDKESIKLLTTLQANPTSDANKILKPLAALVKLPIETVASVIFQIRTNACAVERKSVKAVCALSVFMGYTNHSCAPNATTTVDPEGFVSITALQPLQPGDEVLISYVDTQLPRSDRRAVLQDHYGFSCNCRPCASGK